MVKVVEALVPGGQASPGPPLGPALGPLGVNIKGIIDKINEETKAFNGMQVPVKVIVDDNKEFTIEVGTPPTTALIMKEIGIEKGSGLQATEVAGNLTLEQAINIAKMKKTGTFARSMKNQVKSIVGTCGTLGVTFEGLKYKEAIESINSGKFDSELAGSL